MPRADRPYTSIQVIDRMNDLLSAISHSEGSTSLKVLSAEAGLHPSTAFRILAALAEHGFVERDAIGHYQLGSKFLQFGEKVHERLDMSREARPILEWLRGEVNETANLSVPEGDEAVYVERALSARPPRVEHLIGSRAALHMTAVGKLFLAERGRQGCLQYTRRHRLKAHTPNTITDAFRLQEEVERAARDGFALDNEETEVGVGCIAAPVRNYTGRLVAAISVCAPIERRRPEWIPLVMEAAARLTRRLGYAPAVAQANRQMPLGNQAEPRQAA